MGAEKIGGINVGGLSPPSQVVLRFEGKGLGSGAGSRDPSPVVFTFLKTMMILEIMGWFFF